MANYCEIKNKKKLSLEQINVLLVNELSRTFKLNVNSNLDIEGSEIELEINGWFFYVPLDNNHFSFLDCPDQALERNNHENTNLNKSIQNSFYYAGISCAYCFLHEYIKNFLAEFMETKIDSEGIGKYQAFENRERFKSFSSWMEYCETELKKVPYWGAINVLSKNQILEYELTLFPELK